MIESNNQAEVAARLAAIMDNADDLDVTPPDGSTTSASIGGCVWGAVGTANACAMVRPVLCIVGSVVTACNCLPLIVDEWEEYSCPFFG